MKYSSPIYGSSQRKTERTQRYPQYSDTELQPFFAEISAGYCVTQAAERCLYLEEWIINTLHSDDETYGYVLDLAMVAGAKIRAGELPVPDRTDRLYEEYRR